MHEFVFIIFGALVAVVIFCAVAACLKPHSTPQEAWVNFAVMGLIIAGLYQIGEVFVFFARTWGWL